MERKGGIILSHGHKKLNFNILKSAILILIFAIHWQQERYNAFLKGCRRYTDLTFV